MSKKSRRARTPNLPPEAFHAPAATATPASKPAAAGKNAPSAPAAEHAKTAGVNWRVEYGAVLGDLKRTAIIASVMLAVMVALSFIIP
jgi:hypothetical protein